jgi:hypothetical protein
MLRLIFFRMAKEKDEEKEPEAELLPPGDEELAGDGGHYDEFGTRHDVNYHLRTIAHNTMLVLDPEERWPGIRAGQVTANDGGQHHAWPHHNGAVSDAAEWQRQKALYDIADLLAFEDRGDYLYVAGDATRRLRNFFNASSGTTSTAWPASSA